MFRPAIEYLSHHPFKEYTMKFANRRWIVPAVVGALVLAACGSDGGNDASDASQPVVDATTSQGSTAPNDTATDGTSDTGGGTSDGESCLGEVGCVPAGQPDVNGDGVVKIGVLSPGDTSDNGYYESFVVAGRDIAEANGWELTILDKVNPADAAEQARNLCRQGVDMVAIAAGELADAIPVSEEDVCADSVWYVAGGAGVEQTPYFFQTSEDPGPTQFATGYATGLVMDTIGATKAGYITGPELDFSTVTFDAWTTGLQQVNADFTTVATYTGDFNDSALAQEAATNQLAQGVGILYPYLGGATDAVAAAGAEKDVLSVTPGTDRCTEPQFAVSSIFSPGDYFAAVLKDFEAGTVELGTTRIFVLGVDPVPTVKICDSVEGAADLQVQLDDMIASIAAGDVDVNALIGND